LEYSEDIPAFQYHYSLSGIDPHGLRDAHLEAGCADYWGQGERHLRRMWQHCQDNPHSFAGYGADCGPALSECDGPDTANHPDCNKYQARSISRDDGTLAPGAAIASIDYLPEQALGATRRYSRDP